MTGPHGIMFINEFIIRMLNPLVVVDFRFICIPACIMSSEFTLEREQWNFYLLMIRFLEFYVNVFTGVPNGAARQNTRSSGRIWASWEKKPWQISWLGNLNERLASWKIHAGSGWIKTYIFSPGNRTVIFYMDIGASEASNLAGWQKTVKHDCWLGFLFFESLAG